MASPNLAANLFLTSFAMAVCQMTQAKEIQKTDTFLFGSFLELSKAKKTINSSILSDKIARKKLLDSIHSGVVYTVNNRDFSLFRFFQS